MSLRWVALLGAVATLGGFLLVFLPIFQNPILWGVPTTAPAPAYVLFGLGLFVVGSGVLLYCLLVFTWRNRNSHPSRGAVTMAIYKMSYKPALAGAMAFLLARAATHTLFPTPPSPVKPSPIIDAGTIFWCAIVSLSVAYYLIRYYERIPFSGSIVKSVILSSIALLIFGTLSTLISGSGSYFVAYVLYGSLEFTALGTVIGLTYEKTYGSQTPMLLVVSQARRKGTWMYYLPLLGIIVLFVVYSQYQDYLQPVSFTASAIHFRVSNGLVQVIANITNTSGPSIIQVNAAIDGLDAGICGYDINANQTAVCSFQLIPLPSCSQIPQSGNHTLTLSPYFSNGKMPTSSYSFTSAQLGCS